jgi:hypothetical protein
MAALVSRRKGRGTDTWSERADCKPVANEHRRTGASHGARAVTARRGVPANPHLSGRRSTGRHEAVRTLNLKVEGSSPSRPTRKAVEIVLLRALGPTHRWSQANTTRTRRVRGPERSNPPGVARKLIQLTARALQLGRGPRSAGPQSLQTPACEVGAGCDPLKPGRRGAVSPAEPGWSHRRGAAAHSAPRRKLGAPPRARG